MVNNKPLFRRSTGWSFLIPCIICILAFTEDEIVHQLAHKTQQKLSLFHGTEPVALKIKKCDILISDEGFLRYRKIYLSGKHEYYSLNLSQLKSVDYYGNANAGRLRIQTQADDVIVQTYNDKGGNVDSMSVELNIPFNAVEPEDLSKIQDDLFEIKRLVTR